MHSQGRTLRREGTRKGHFSTCSSLPSPGLLTTNKPSREQACPLPGKMAPTTWLSSSLPPSEPVCSHLAPYPPAMLRLHARQAAALSQAPRAPRSMSVSTTKSSFVGQSGALQAGPGPPSPPDRRGPNLSCWAALTSPWSTLPKFLPFLPRPPRTAVTADSRGLPGGGRSLAGRAHLQDSSVLTCSRVRPRHPDL